MERGGGLRAAPAAKGFVYCAPSSQVMMGEDAEGRVLPMERTPRKRQRRLRRKVSLATPRDVGRGHARATQNDSPRVKPHFHPGIRRCPFEKEAFAHPQIVVVTPIHGHFAQRRRYFDPGHLVRQEHSIHKSFASQHTAKSYSKTHKTRTAFETIPGLGKLKTAV